MWLFVCGHGWSPTRASENERDIKVNNRDLANFNNAVSELRTEFRDIQRRLNKYDDNVNLNLHLIYRIIAQTVPS